MIVFDSHAWIEYFMGSDKGKHVRTYVDGQEEIATPAVCLAEIKHKYMCDGREFDSRLQFIMTRSKVANLTKEIALLAAEKKKEYKLYMVDALVYAAGIYLGAHVLSGDGHFRHLPEVEFLE
ncbi:type II toxin-antitoxin system VapC family toxin [Candidatus Woesearchaeota archaeon]|nr:type II toxin-antitoxin system VapC family toxin [Candidatus Woesearchaeota archaeon]